LVPEVTEAEECERQRLAGILHDDFQQVLAGAEFHLSILDGGARSAETRRDVVLQVKGLPSGGWRQRWCHVLFSFSTFQGPPHTKLREYPATIRPQGHGVAGGGGV
jgi:hypothetical protein